ETGHTATSKEDAERYMRTYNVQDPELAQRIIDLARTSRRKGCWWEGYRGVADVVQVEVADLEDLADSLCNYEPMFVPALLQTEEYSEKVIIQSDPQVYPCTVDPRETL